MRDGQAALLARSLPCRSTKCEPPPSGDGGGSLASLYYFAESALQSATRSCRYFVKPFSIFSTPALISSCW